MSGTTFATIRENAEGLIRSLLPKSRRDVRFKLWEDSRDLVEVATENPGMVRVFEIAHTFGQAQAEVSDLHAVEVDDTFVVQVVYPLRMFAKGAPELEAIIAEDMHQIDDAIGIHGSTNYVQHQHATRLVRPQVNATDAIALLLMEYEVEYTREVN